MKVCAITNVYNESWKLPIWLRYYGRELGYENCIVVDHSSDDGSTKDVSGAGIFRIPRSKFDDGKRSCLISDLANGLLNFYDVVIYTDCDEILIPDPKEYKGLKDYCSKLDVPSIMAIGVNVLHNLAFEAPLELSRPILGQRRFCVFARAMCKTLVVREKVKWGGGFHTSSFPVRFKSLYLFHLHDVDLGASLSRLSITRNLEFARNWGGHQRVDFLKKVDNFKGYASWKIASDGDFSFKDALNKIEESVTFNQDRGLYIISEPVTCPGLHLIPEEFFGRI